MSDIECGISHQMYRIQLLLHRDLSEYDAYPIPGWEPPFHVVPQQQCLISQLLKLPEKCE